MNNNSCAACYSSCDRSDKTTNSTIRSSDACPEPNLWKRVGRINLAGVKSRLLRQESTITLGIRAEHLEELELSYRRFLFLCAIHPDRVLVPTQAIDEIWHCHILATRQYAADCANAFGFFLHHFPLEEETDGSSPDNASAFADTKNAFVAEFGQEPFGQIAADCCSRCYGAPSDGRIDHAHIAISANS